MIGICSGCGNQVEAHEEHWYTDDNALLCATCALEQYLEQVRNEAQRQWDFGRRMAKKLLEDGSPGSD